MEKYWVLDGKTPRRATQDEWGRMFENFESRCVARTEIGDMLVSTVFLGIDHGFGFGEPLLFETMILNDDLDDSWCERCSTWAQAEEQHQAAVTELKLRCGSRREKDHGHDNE